MLQFEIWRLKPTREAKSTRQLVVILQHPRLQDLDTTVVAPLRSASELPAVGRLKPEIQLSRKRYRVIIDRLSVISRSALLERIGSAAEFADPIKRATDQLLYGN